MLTDKCIFDMQFDSMIVPAIFVSPCNSESDVDPRAIQGKAKEVAKYILLKAINLHLNESDLQESDENLDLDLSSAELKLLSDSKDLVLKIMEQALELSLADVLSSQGSTDSVINSEAVAAVFNAVDPEQGMTPQQTQIFFRAKEIVNGAVNRTFVIYTGINAMNAAMDSIESENEIKEESERFVKVEDVVKKVVIKAIKYFLEKIDQGKLERNFMKRGKRDCWKSKEGEGGKGPYAAPLILQRGIL
jgi:hypothetical protein